MAGATQVTINVILSGGIFFSSTSFTGLLSIDGGASLAANFTATTTTASATVTTPIAPGNHSFVLTILNTNFVPQPAVSGTIGIVFFQFNDTPPTSTTQVNLVANVPAGESTATVSVTVACIHGSSMIETRNGLKRIDQLTTDDEVLSGDNLDTYVKIKGVAQCWIKAPGPSHDAIIIEAGALGNNEPFQRLIIDPGHPMSIKSEYLEKGMESLRPAGEYLGRDGIHVKKWADPDVQEQPSVRYDLILEEPNKMYLANGVVVRSAGYPNHSYKHLI